MQYHYQHITGSIKKQNWWILLMLLFISFALSSCEEVDVVENNTAFEEKIVVATTLKANTSFEGVVFIKTLPFNEEFNIKIAELKDVQVYLRQNGHKIIPLHYTFDGIYNSIYDVVPVPGDVFELFALYNGQSVYSITTIPKEPGIYSSIVTGDNFIEVFIYPNQNEVYGALWVFSNDNNEVKSPDFFRIYESKLITPGITLYLRTDEIPVQYRGVSSKLLLRVAAFDEQYIDYFQTRNNNQPVNDVFSQVGAPVKWNVYGDNVIGLFIGMAETTVSTK